MKFMNITKNKVKDIMPSLESYLDWMNQNTNVNRKWDRSWVEEILLDLIEQKGLACAAVKDEEIKGVVIFEKTQLIFDEEATGTEFCWHVDKDLSAREKVTLLGNFISLAEDWAKKNKIKKLLVSAQRNNPITKKLIKMGFYETETYYRKEVK